MRYGAKPSWMDGANRQKQRATILKDEIKRKAARRREEANITDTAPDVGFHVVPDLAITGDIVNSHSRVGEESAKQERKDLGTASAGSEVTLVASLPWSHRQQQGSETLDQASASEANFITKYLDFFFPALFPFYRPHVFDSGRS
ncbi:hypothetical protein SLS59_007448 [Nothophoma quercina]|uniref:Uncharacterized protein n=1 Tax=Nothophoma quercina TaxID=749835 RepID=A0ABR3QZJ9_9PLEO